MALVKQRNSFPVVAGQEQGIAPELVDPPVLLRAHNCLYTRQGELTKRRGWVTSTEAVVGEQYLPHTYLPQPERLARRGDEILWIGGTIPYYYHDAYPPWIFSRIPAEAGEDTPPPTWQAKGEIPRFNSEKIAEVNHTHFGLRIEAWDCAFAGDALDPVFSRGVVCMIWRTRVDVDGLTFSRIEYAAIDIATGANIAQGTIVSNAYHSTPIRVVAAKHVGGKWHFHIYYIRDDTVGVGDLTEVTIDAATPWANSGETLVEGNIDGFDVCVTDPDVAVEQRLCFVATNAAESYYRFNLGLPTVGGIVSWDWRVVYPISAVVTGLPMARTVQCVFSPDGRHVGAHLVVVSPGCAGTIHNVVAQFGIAASPSHTMSFYDDAVSSLDTTSNGDGGCQIGWAGNTPFGGFPRSDNWILTWEMRATYQERWKFSFAGAGTLIPSAAQGLQLAFMPWGRPFHYEGNNYCPVVRGVIADTCCVDIISVSEVGTGGDPAATYRVDGRALAGEIAFGLEPGDIWDFPLCSGRNSIVESYYERGRFFGAFPIASLDGTEHRLALVEFSAVDRQQYNWAELSGATYFASSIPWCYDGGTGHELNFPHRPQSYQGEIIGLAVTPASGEFLAEGDYIIAACWESVDSLGRVSRSAPSFSQTVTIGPSQTLAITYLELGLSSHNGIRLVVYTSNDGGVNYIRSKQPITYLHWPYTQVSVTLEAPELFQAGMPTLYTDSGILENSPVPPARYAAAWQNRLWLAEGRLVLPSKELVDTEEPSFNEALAIQMPFDCSGIVGVDDRFVIFSKDAIHWLSGDGPTDTGEGGTFGNPQRLPTDFGCIDARSIVRTEKGVCFQSRRGIELLDRMLTPRLISGGVDKLLREDGYNEILSASWDPEAQVCRFLARNTVSVDAYYVLCWHTLFEVWTTHGVPVVATTGRTNVPNGIVNAFNRNWMALGDAAAYNVAPQCRLAREWHVTDQVAQYLDGPISTPYWYEMAIETANIKLDGLTGFARVWRADILVKNKSNPTGFTLNYAIDYAVAESSTDRVWETADDIASGATPSTEHFRYGMHLEKQQCSAIRLYIKDHQLNDGLGATYATSFTLVGFGLEWGQEPGTGRGRERSKK
jgi:hypothetical protein